jgi:hypothetical protein
MKHDCMKGVISAVSVEGRKSVAGEVCASDTETEGEWTHIINSISGNPVEALEEYQETIHHSESS